jgi:hypothetical protein
MLQSRSSIRTRAQNLSNLPSPSSRLGRLFLPCGRNSVIPLCSRRSHLAIAIRRLPARTPHAIRASLLASAIARTEARIESEVKTSDQDLRQSASYWLESIRMTAKDSDTKAISCAAKLVSCAAKLKAKIGDHGANVDITYKVEMTTDGKLYATVHNLVDAYEVDVGYKDYPIGGQAR